jgi:hypothetical protein
MVYFELSLTFDHAENSLKRFTFIVSNAFLLQNTEGVSFIYRLVGIVSNITQ